MASVVFTVAGGVLGFLTYTFLGKKTNKNSAGPKVQATRGKEPVVAEHILLPPPLVRMLRAKNADVLEQLESRWDKLMQTRKVLAAKTQNVATQKYLTKLLQLTLTRAGDVEELLGRLKGSVPATYVGVFAEIQLRAKQECELIVSSVNGSLSRLSVTGSEDDE
eukprot:gnl/Hemi2/3471_TR1209_c0_g1_i1.p2 gnl/Hemi2/3471_TR1209_c0_g1~~gnl/Hemi2/3471_TR1209_c0_g1_i1.p2  ORF type:complete len:177 (+),score=34.04 gnl/Hemi2/3471_TR1209_c0_g1_i1:41-532(+)